MVYVEWEQAKNANAHVEYSFDKGVWASSPTKLATKGTNKQILVGIPFDTDVALRVVADDSGTTDGPLVHTGLMPGIHDTYPIPLPTLVTWDESNAFDGGKYLITSPSLSPSERMSTVAKYVPCGRSTSKPASANPAGGGCSRIDTQRRYARHRPRQTGAGRIRAENVGALAW
jgi:hypothetical protein